MNEILEFETYLSISRIKFGIYLFDTKNRNNLYVKEINFKKTNFINYSHLKQFLDEKSYKPTFQPFALKKPAAKKANAKKSSKKAVKKPTRRK